MWVCEKCKEENEDSFDSCWSCQELSKTGSVSSKIHQQKIIKKEEGEKIKNSKGFASWLNRKPLIPILLGIFFISWWGFRYYSNQLERENQQWFEENSYEFNKITGKMEFHTQEEWDSINDLYSQQGFESFWETSFTPPPLEIKPPPLEIKREFKNPYELEFNKITGKMEFHTQEEWDSINDLYYQ